MQGVPGDAWRQLASAVAGQVTQLRGWGPDALPGEAARHGLVPLLDLRLHEGSLTGATPMQSEQLAFATRHAAAFDLARTAADRAFCALLGGAGHELLLLKGAATARRLYAQPYLRVRCDTDVYIRAAERLAIEAVLGAAGYTLVRHAARPLTSQQFQAARESFQGERLWFDIHTAPSNRAVFRHCLPFDNCLREASPLPGLHPAARAPANHDLLLHTCLHRIAHGRGSARDRLIWLYDIHLLVLALDGHGLDSFTARALDRKVGVVCAAAIGVARDAFGTPLPSGLLERLRSRAASEPSAGLVDAGKWAWLWSDLRGQNGWKARWSFLGEVWRNRLGRA